MRDRVQWVKSFIVAVCRPLKIMAEENLAHSDLKPANIVFNFAGDKSQAILRGFGSTEPRTFFLPPEMIERKTWIECSATR